MLAAIAILFGDMEGKEAMPGNAHILVKLFVCICGESLKSY